MLTKQNCDNSWRLEAFRLLLQSRAAQGGAHFKLGSPGAGAAGGGGLEREVRPWRTASFGAKSFSVAARIVAAEPYEAHAALTNAAALRGKIALCVRGGDATFVAKARRAQAAGALALIVVNAEAAGVYARGGGVSKTRSEQLTWRMGGGGDAVDGSDVTIPCVMVTASTGAELLDGLAGLGLARLKRGNDACALLSRFRAPIVEDGAIDRVLAAGSLFSEEELGELRAREAEVRAGARQRRRHEEIFRRCVEQFGDAAVVEEAFNSALQGLLAASGAAGAAAAPTEAMRLQAMEQVAPILGVELPPPGGGEGGGKLIGG